MSVWLKVDGVEVRVSNDHFGILFFDVDVANGARD
jgi:hypothetical protein